VAKGHTDSDADYHITIVVILNEAKRNEGSWWLSARLSELRLIKFWN